MDEILCTAFTAEPDGNGRFRIRYQTAEQSPLLSVDDIATELGVTIRSIYAWCNRRRDPIPHIRTGRHYRFNKLQVLAWAAKAGRGIPTDFPR